MILSTKKFLPYEDITKKNLENEKEDNKGIKLLIVLIFILLPFTVKALSSEDKNVVKNEIKVVESKNQIDDIVSWIKISGSNITGEIKGNIGNFKIYNKNILNEINKDNTLKVIFFEKIENGGYNIRVQKK